MKLIVEHYDGEAYVYIESEEQFEAVEPNRRKDRTRLDCGELANECCLNEYPDDIYFVFDIVAPGLKKKDPSEVF